MEIMKKIQILGWVLFGLLGMLAPVQAANQQAQESLNGFLDEVQTDTNQLIQEILGNIDFYKQPENEEQLRKVTESYVLSKFSIKAFTQIVMGKYLRRHKDKIDEFSETLKKNVMDIYVRAFYSDEDIEGFLKGLKIQKGKAIAMDAKKGKVGLVVENGKNGKKYLVDLSLVYSKKKQDWVVVNIEFEGINLGINFRKQFASLYESERGYEGVVAKWSEGVEKAIASEEK